MCSWGENEYCQLGRKLSETELTLLKNKSNQNVKEFEVKSETFSQSLLNSNQFSEGEKYMGRKIYIFLSNCNRNFRVWN